MLLYFTGTGNCLYAAKRRLRPLIFFSSMMFAHYSLSRPSGRLFCIPPGPGNTIGDDPAGSLADRPGRPFRPASSEGPGGVAAGDGSPRQATDRDVPGDGPTAS